MIYILTVRDVSMWLLPMAVLAIVPLVTIPAQRIHETGWAQCTILRVALVYWLNMVTYHR